MFGLSDCDVHSVVPLAVPLVWTHSQGTRPTRHRHWALAIAARHRPSPSAYGDRVTVTTLSCTISPQTITPAAGAPVTWWSSPPPPLPPSSSLRLPSGPPKARRRRAVALYSTLRNNRPNALKLSVRVNEQ